MMGCMEYHRILWNRVESHGISSHGPEDFRSNRHESEIVCISRADGRIHWVRGLPRFEDPEDQEDPITWTGPLLTSDRLVVAGSNGEALAVSPYSGRVLGVEEMPDGVTVAPVVAGGSVYFLADDAELVAYR